jgi:hypothetical protein
MPLLASSSQAVSTLMAALKLQATSTPSLAMGSQATLPEIAQSPWQHLRQHLAWTKTLPANAICLQARTPRADLAYPNQTGFPHDHATTRALECRATPYESLA